MITRPQLTNIGSTIKPHGISGEIAAAIDSYVDLATLKCIILEMDGIYVPFFLSSMRSRGAEAVLITLDGITNEIEAKQLCGKTVYGLKDECDALNADESNDDGFYAEDLIGYRILIGQNQELGEISDVDTSTENALFVITTVDSRQMYIPVADEFIIEIDTDANSIYMSLPDGLLDL